jgi:hypothetical protein
VEILIAPAYSSAWNSDCPVSWLAYVCLFVLRIYTVLNFIVLTEFCTNMSFAVILRWNHEVGGTTRCRSTPPWYITFWLIQTHMGAWLLASWSSKERMGADWYYFWTNFSGSYRRRPVDRDQSAAHRHSGTFASLNIFPPSEAHCSGFHYQSNEITEQSRLCRTTHWGKKKREKGKPRIYLGTQTANKTTHQR